MGYTIPEAFVPYDGMNLEGIPEVDHDEVASLVRTSLVVVSEGESSHDVSLKADYRDYPQGSAYVEVTAEDILWKWEDMKSKGGNGYDGVYRTTEDDHTVYHFWNDATNDTCDESHHATTEYPLPLARDEALWLAHAIGLNVTEEVCRTNEFDEEKYFYRFGLNPNQINTYIERMESHYTRYPDSISDERYRELKSSIEDLKPSSHFWEGVEIFIVGGAGAGGVVGGGAWLWNKFSGKSPPQDPQGPSGGGSDKIRWRGTSFRQSPSGLWIADKVAAGVEFAEAHPVLALGVGTVMLVGGAFATGVLVIDDGTVVLVVDDVAIPFTLATAATGGIMIGVAAPSIGVSTPSSLDEEQLAI